MSSSEKPDSYLMVRDVEGHHAVLQTTQGPDRQEDAGKIGTLTECLAYVEAAWNDIRPISIRFRELSPASKESQPPADSQIGFTQKLRGS
jgi:uncharacterized protein YbdZ (MbtH family)